jgi:hypothetical protein
VPPFSTKEREFIIETAVKRHRLRREDAEAMFAASSRPAKRNPLLGRQWASLLHRMCNAIRTGDDQPRGIFHSVFWIRLQGAITEIRERFEWFSELRDSLSQGSPSRPWAAAGAEIFDASEAIRAALSEDELVYVAFARATHAHVYQDGFEYAIEPSGQPRQRGAIRRKTKVRALGRAVNVDEAHQIVNRIHLAHGNDESKIALAFAQKVASSVERLDHAIEAFDAITNALDAAD